MQNKARSIINSVIPATQYALNAVNQHVAQPIEQTVGQAQAQLPFVNMQAANPKTGMDTLQGYLDTAKRITSGKFGQGGLGNTYNDISNSMNLLPEGGFVGDIKTMAREGDPATLFGRTLRSAQDMLPPGAMQDVHADDIKALDEPVQRVLNTPHSDMNYQLMQLPKDHSIIQPIAEHYMPGVTKFLNNDPIGIARAVVQRIVGDRFK